MIKNFLRKRRHVRFVHSRLYTLKYEMLNMSLSITKDGSIDMDVLKNKALLFKKYQRRLRLLKF